MIHERMQAGTAIVASITAWAGVFNFIATGLAISVSICALIISGPKAYVIARNWIRSKL